jgi:hypothetical protein
MIAPFPVGWGCFAGHGGRFVLRDDHTRVALLFRFRGRDSLHRAPARDLLDEEIPVGGFAAMLPTILAGERTRILL